jgi:phenylalanine-4-hydroxylase
MNYLSELSQFVIDQNYSQYTVSDFEVWKNVLTQQNNLINMYSHQIAPAYLSGLTKLGIASSNIPHLNEINKALQPVGWHTACVNGYISEVVYFRFIANKIFPVSRNLRKAQHIDHSPIPDFIHDVIGHLPLLFIQDYQNILLRIAKLNTLVKGNELDVTLSKTNLELALLKESLDLSNPQIQDSLKKIEQIRIGLKKNPTTLTKLNRLFLWSVEFGLMGTVNDYKCFGAGLLSSPTELQNALHGGNTKVLPYTLDVINYDINFTDTQNQFFVIRDFKNLVEIINQFELSIKKE